MAAYDYPKTVAPDLGWPKGLPREFGPMLEYHRERRSIARRDLAASSGIDISYLSRLENDARTPSFDMVSSLARSMDLSTWERDALFVAAGYAPDAVHRIWLPIYGRFVSLDMENGVASAFETLISQMKGQ